MRLSDLPEPYAVVVLLPAVGGAAASTPRTVEVNGRVARFIAWMLDHKQQIEASRSGHVLFNYGPQSYQAELKETFPHEGVVPSANAMRGDVEP